MKFALAEDEHHGIGSPMNGVHGAVTLDRAADGGAFLAARWRDSRSLHHRAEPHPLTYVWIVTDRESPLAQN